MKVSEMRKAVVAAATNALTLVTAFNTVVPVSGQVAAAVTAVSTVLVYVVTYFTRNDVADVLDKY